MKKSYEIYEIGSKVYGISSYYKDGVDTKHCAILPAIVRSCSIDYNKNTNKKEISYWLATPNGDEWGDSVPDNHVAETFNELVNRMKPIWEGIANTF